MDKFNEVKHEIGYLLTPTDIASFRSAKHEAVCHSFCEMVKVKEVDSKDLFNHIHACFEENSHARPYHDWYHTCCVLEGTIRGLRYHQHIKNTTSFNPETQQKAINATILAAAFHDIGHTGVKNPDIVNVSRSILIAHQFLAGINHNYKGSTYSCEVDVPLVLETLQSTQYPFHREPINEYQAILRDADLLQILEPTWFDDIYCNMYQEFLEGNNTLDFVEFCRNEMAFMSNAKFYSTWFNDKMAADFSNIAITRVNKAVTAAALINTSFRSLAYGFVAQS